MGLLKRASLVLGRGACLRQLAEDASRLAAAALHLSEKSSSAALEDFGLAAAGTDVGLELARLLYGDPAIDRFRAIRVAELEARVTANEAKAQPSKAPSSAARAAEGMSPKEWKAPAASATRRDAPSSTPTRCKARPAPDETTATGAALAAGLRPAEIYRAIQRGEITARKPGPRCIRVSKAEVAKYAAAKAAKESA